MNITKAINLNPKQIGVNAKSVLQRLHTIPLIVKKYYTDVNGTIISKAAAPVLLQNRVPVYLLGEFDRQGGYKAAQKIVPPDNGIFFQQTFVQGFGGTTSNIVGVNPLNEIKNFVAAGDVVIVYTDDLSAPTTYLWIVIKSLPNSYASVLSNSMSIQDDKRLGKLKTFEINFQVSDNSQFTQDWNFTRFDNMGNFKSDFIQPLGIYRSIFDKQRDLITLKLIFDITQFLGLSLYMLYACDSLQIDLKIIK